MKNMITSVTGYSYVDATFDDIASHPQMHDIATEFLKVVTADSALL